MAFLISILSDRFQKNNLTYRSVKRTRLPNVLNLVFNAFIFLKSLFNQVIDRVMIYSFNASGKLMLHYTWKFLV